MNLRFNTNLCLFLLATAMHSAVGTSGRALVNNPKIIMAEDPVARPNTFIVVYKPPSEGGKRSHMLMEQTAEEVAQTVPDVKVIIVYSASIQGFAAEMTPDAAQEIAKSDDVDYIQQDSIVKGVVLDDGVDTTEQDTSNIFTKRTNQQVTWGLDRVDQRDLPLDNSYTVANDGSDVYAYIIDTGIQITHNEFKTPAGQPRATWGINTAGDGIDNDCDGHGTHVAGTVGGLEYGVAKNVNLVAVKVLDCNGNGYVSDVIEGIEWVQTNAVGKKATANMSLGGGYSQAENDAVKFLHESGVPTVVAGGNDNDNACDYSPASEPVAITVGSTTNSDSRSWFSNYGTCLDIFAPGSSITAAWIGDDDATNTISGTSMASPHVCGGVALLLEEGIDASGITSELISRATDNKVTDAKTGSPNKLLYVGATMAPTAPPTPAPPTPAPTGDVRCVEDGEATFTFTNYMQRDVIKKCEWMYGKKWRQKKACRQSSKIGEDRAEDVCTRTCEKWMKFPHVKPNNQTVTKACNWLKNRGYNRRNTICATNANAAKTCFKICGACN